MSEAFNIVPCPCGVNIRLPENAKQRILRCPKCKRGLPLTADSTLLASTVWTESETRVICPICQAPIGVDEEVVTCPDCKRIHHTECWAEVGGCGMYGCRHAFPTEKKADQGTMANPKHVVWENERATCPVCREIISRTASVCPFCKSSIEVRSGRLVSNLNGKSKGQKLRTATVWLFALSFIPCFAPIIVIISGILVWRKRARLAGFGQIYPVLTFLSLGISSLFSLLMLVFLVFGG